MTSIDVHNEKDLLRLVSQGDAEAFRRFFDLYKSRLFVFVDQLIHSKADTEEIVQDTFMKLWEMGPRLVAIEYPGQYVYMIARNKTLNYMRKAASHKNLMTQVWANYRELDNSLEEKLNGRDVNIIIQQALSQLPTQKQTIFRLSREGGLSHAEIAQQLGLSQSRVKNILVEVLKQIKDSLHAHSDLLAILFWIKYSEHFF